MKFATYNFNYFCVEVLSNYNLLCTCLYFFCFRIFLNFAVFSPLRTF
jgi:hypothetical protein